MRKSIVAIVGRPNVGKSTLFNRICRERSAIVDFEEGITRDRKYQAAEWNGIYFTLVDTGGIVQRSDDKMDMAVRLQAEVAIEQADQIIFLLDLKTGITDIDLEISRILSLHREKVMLVVNKVDNEKDELELYEFMQLGFGEPIGIAAAHGRNCGNFLDELVPLLNPVKEEDVEVPRDQIKIAIVGKPNVGKSSLINRLLGEEANIVTDIPGTTRDSLDQTLRYHGEDFIFVDTAGLRRKTKIKYGVDYFSSMRTIEAIHESNMVILVLDAQEKVSTQELKIASFAERHKRDVMLLVNKWDLIEKDNKTFGEFVKEIRYEMPFLSYAPVMFVSALTGQRVSHILERVIKIKTNSKKRISTAELNKFLSTTTQRFAPAHSSGKHTKIYYCTQTEVNPPTFVFFCNDEKLITKHYQKFIENQLRATFDLEGVSFRMHFRGRSGEESERK
ncbi:MAG: ribosome biogenesis GTPase Der [Candidatus Cloacimonetes bacterium]|nr:ribosome biogenesis GTPase Der [Candidatus Cloacimonadota bacterium]